MSWNRNVVLLTIGALLLIAIFSFSAIAVDRSANAGDPLSRPGRLNDDPDPEANATVKPAGGDLVGEEKAQAQTAKKTVEKNAVKGTQLAGLVKFAGPRPPRRPIAMFANRGGSRLECARLHKTPPLSEETLVSEKGELANVFVYVRKGLKKKEYPLPKKPVIVDQQGCMFRPRVQGIRVGQELVMRNGDKLTHNVRSYAFRNRPFNIAQPADSEDRKKVFRRPEREVMLGCDIHKWMKAYVFVMDHPFHAVSNAKGEYKIQGLPAGKYTIVAWHEVYGEQKVEVTVAEEGTTKLGFTFKPKSQ